MKSKIHSGIYDEGFKIRLNYLIKYYNYTNKQVARSVGVSKTEISQWRNFSNPHYPQSLKHINALCKKFNVKASWLLKGFIYR